MRIDLFNSRAPNALRVPVTVNIVQNDLVHTNDGEPVFIIALDVGILSSSSQKIDTVVLNDIAKENIKEEIQRGLSIIASQINWQNLEDDNQAPIITYIYPEDKNDNISIDSNVSINLRDEFPMTGIDPSTIKLTVNDVDVTNELHLVTKDNQVTINWVPNKVKNIT